MKSTHNITISHAAKPAHTHACGCRTIKTKCGESTIARVREHTCACGCCCAQNDDTPSRERQETLLSRVFTPVTRLAAGTVFFIAGMLTRQTAYLSLTFFILSAVLSGSGVAWRAVRGLMNGHFFSEHLLMTIASVGAFVIGEPEEGCAVLLFYLLGTLLENYAEARTRRSINALADLRPRTAHRQKPDGTTEDLEPCRIPVGDTILVFAGERVPLDGILLSTDARLDYSALTGESLPAVKRYGEEILAGAINSKSTLRLQVSRTERDSAIMKILDLAQAAEKRKTRIESFTTRFARVYTPAVVILAALLAFLPPLIFPGETLKEWGYRALGFLVISCPCALVISVPLTFISGMGCASRRGILIRGSSSLEALSGAAACVFDKTGTITSGRFSVTRIVTGNGVSTEKLIRFAAAAESQSGHPLAAAIRSLFARDDHSSNQENRKTDGPPDGRSEPEKEPPPIPRDIQAFAGLGIRAVVEEHETLIGSRQFLESRGIAIPGSADDDTLPAASVVHAAIGQQWAGVFYVEDTVRPPALEAVQRLRALGIGEIAVFSGDRDGAAVETGRRIGADRAFGSMMPEDKLTHLEKMRSNTSGNILFVGDGINDAPSLRLADAGIAMGGLGTDAAIEAADVVIMTDDLRRVPDAVAIARKTTRILHQNIAFILFVKLSLLLLGALGLSALWAAIFADTGVMVLAVLNALRAAGANVKTGRSSRSGDPFTQTA